MNLKEVPRVVILSPIERLGGHGREQQKRQGGAVSSQQGPELGPWDHMGSSFPNRHQPGSSWLMTTAQTGKCLIWILI